MKKVLEAMAVVDVPLILDEHEDVVVPALAELDVVGVAPPQLCDAFA